MQQTVQEIIILEDENDIREYSGYCKMVKTTAKQESQEEIVKNIVKNDNESVLALKLSDMRYWIDNIMHNVESSSNPEVLAY